MIFDPERGKVLDNKGWAEGGSIWSFDLETRTASRIPVEGARYLNLRSGEGGYFRVVHGGSNSTISSIRHLNDPEAICSSVRIVGEDAVVEGDVSLWQLVDPVFTIGLPSGFRILRVDVGTSHVADIDLSWYVDGKYDLGYQSLYDCLTMMDEREIVLSVQRSSTLLIADSLSGSLCGRIDLRGRGGNPQLAKLSNQQFLASDYDTLCRVDIKDRKVVAAVHLQQGTPESQRQFIGDYELQGDGSCVVARPFSNDVLRLDCNFQETGQAKVECQPLALCMISSEICLVRDWKSGLPFFCSFS